MNGHLAHMGVYAQPFKVGTGLHVIGEKEQVLAIVVVGSVALDSVETPFRKVDDVLGGAASYFSLAAALYAPVNLVAIIGEDFPSRFLDEFRARPIDLAGVRRMPGQTFRWGGRYHLDMNARETLYTELGVFADFAPEMPAGYRQSPILFLANIHPQLQLDVLVAQRRLGTDRKRQRIVPVFRRDRGVIVDVLVNPSRRLEARVWSSVN